MKLTTKLEFLPMKAAAAYIQFSTWWLRHNGDKKGFPKRVVLSPRKVGYWKHELDAWLVKMARRSSGSRKASA